MFNSVVFFFNARREEMKLERNHDRLNFMIHIGYKWSELEE